MLIARLLKDVAKEGRSEGRGGMMIGCGAGHTIVGTLCAPTIHLPHKKRYGRYYHKYRIHMIHGPPSDLALLLLLASAMGG